MIIPFRKTSLHIHPLFPGLILFCLFTGHTGVLYTLLALFLHETGHLLFLMLFRKTPRQFSLTPFGALMETPPEGTLSPLQSFFIALGGPLFSFLGCAFCLLGFRQAFLPLQFSLSFFRTNLLLFLFNLLPCLPLDGGRMLQAVLSRFLPGNSVQKALLSLSHLVSLGLVLLSVHSAMQGQYSFAPAFAGAYLMYAAGLEGKRSPLRYYSSLIGRRSENRLSYPVQQLAVSADTPLYALPPRLKEDYYHMLHIVGSDGMQLLGTLGDGDFCSLLMQDSQMTASDALKHVKKQRS